MNFIFDGNKKTPQKEGPIEKAQKVKPLSP